MTTLLRINKPKMSRQIIILLLFMMVYDATHGSLRRDSVPAFVPKPPKTGPPKVEFAAPERLEDCGRVTPWGPGRKAVWPWLALVGEGQREGVAWRCNAVLLNSRWLLTAAHCTVSRTSDVVRLGGVLSDDDRTFKTTLQHPLYRVRGHPVYHDMALIRLERPATLSDDVRPVCLPEQADGGSLVHKRLTKMMYGYDVFTHDSSGLELQQGMVTALPVDRCSYFATGNQQFLDGLSDDTVACIGKPVGKLSGCTGSSGSPVTLRHSGHHELVAIVSSGRSCDLDEFPEVSVPVTSPLHLNWIRDTAFTKGPPCGTRPRPDNPELWPWLGLLATIGPDGTRWICNGALVHRRWVVTSARCFADIRPGDSNFVRFGGPDGRTNINVVSSAIHPQYPGPESGEIRNDVALLKLEKEAFYEEEIVPICLPRAWTDPPGGGTNFVKLTLATDVLHKQPLVMRAQNLSAVPQKECEGRVALPAQSPYANLTYACFVKPTVKQVCLGSSGAPVMAVNSVGLYEMAAIVLSDADCASPYLHERHLPLGTPDVAEWIVKTIYG